MNSQNENASRTLPRPLEGLRVLDLTVALSGPYGTLLLAGLGAEVIKVEGPTGGDIARANPPFVGPKGIHFDGIGEGDVSISILSRARNKKGITLDLKTERGREIFMRLARVSDVVVENMSDGTAKRLGVGYEAVRAANPKIIYASIAGLGEGSEIPNLKAMDVIVQALSGLMDVTGFADGPPIRCGIPITDMLAPLFAVSGILAAVIQRNRTGVGQHVKVNMLDCAASLLSLEHFDVFQRGGFQLRTGNHQNRLAPFGIYATLDGHVAIGATADAWVMKIFDAIGRPELKADPRFQVRGQRFQHADVLNEIIESWTRTRPSEEVTTELLAKRSVPCVRVRKVSEVLGDPAIRARGAVVGLSHRTRGPIDALAPGMPITFSAARAGYDQPAPDLGTHNAEVYRELLGMSPAELADLEAKGIV